MQQLRYTAVFEPAEEGGYIVTFPAVPGLATQGENLDEARAMAAGTSSPRSYRSSQARSRFDSRSSSAGSLMFHR